jgi:peptidoglycan/LPS O-acetylase OafA/YrhL
MPSSVLVRLRSLDGLRGYAALTVVFCHALITSQLYFASLYEPIPASRWSVSWFLGHPPLNLLWAGNQAVIIFFVLSGLVVTLPFVSSSMGWFGYYPRRFLRLYLPTWAAVGFAAILATLVHRHAVVGASGWLSVHANPHWPGVRRDLTLVHGTDGLNGPLWSLQWEVIFSALLPAFVVLARVAPRAVLQKIVVMLALTAVGVHTGHKALQYLPAFGAGAALAGDLDGVAQFGVWLRRWRLGPWVLLVVAAGLLDSYSLVVLHGGGLRLSAQTELPAVATVAGATLLVTLASVASPIKAACDSRLGQWLGIRSFSLYLVHEPIVVSVALLLGKGASVWAIFAISVPIAIATSWLFQKLVEGPAHDLARAVGRAMNPMARERAPATGGVA